MKQKLCVLLEKVLFEFNLKKTKEFNLKVPPQEKFGDLASNIALLYAPELKEDPFVLAQKFKEKLLNLDQGKIYPKIEIAKPGFLNFFLADSFLQQEIFAIVKSEENYGKSQTLKGKKILLEFVSANPTGPLHVGHGRWAVVGDVIGSLLEAMGCQVEREYYINDLGRQIDLFIDSVRAIGEGRDIPEGGYGGTYVKRISEDPNIRKRLSENQTSSRGTSARGNIRDQILSLIIEEQKKTLENLGIKFDCWFYESKLHQEQKVKGAVEKLHDLGKTFEEGGAIWFKSQALGDDKNRVLIRENGESTYFAADIAYHLNKFSRGYDQLINIWGTDHHGYAPRLKAAMKALDQPVDKLEIIIGQLVTLYRGKEPVRMSKRTGEMVTLQEVIEEIGKEATRFFFAASNVNTHLDFDLELAKKQSQENPVYYLQYAHARICSILKKSETEKQETGNKKQETGNRQPATDLHPAERKLMLKLVFFPAIVEEAAKLRQPHLLTEYGKELAAVFHQFYEQCRVLGNPARLVLVKATRIVLRNVLKLLGISAPEEM